MRRSLSGLVLIVLAVSAHGQNVRVPRSANAVNLSVIRSGVAEARLLTAANPIALASPCSESEPNQEIAEANPILPPSTCSGSASSTDPSAIEIDYETFTDGLEDLFVLNLPAAAQLTIELTYPSTSADFDLFLFYMTPENRIRFVTTAAHDAPGTAEKIAMPYSLTPGSYYIGVSAFSGSSSYTLQVSAPGFSETCTPDVNSLCLSNGRFRLQADYGTTTGETGKGQGVLLTSDTGYFWFFNAANVEVIVKVLDACAFNSRFWVFSGGMTDVNVKLKATDTVTGVTKEYENALRSAYKTITDTGAFATCSPTACTFTVSPTSQDFGASGGTGSVAVTTTAGCAWTASASDSWITITGGATGTGNGNVSYSVAANSGTSSRSGSLTVAGKTVAITQTGAAAGCTFSVSPSSLQFPGSGGTATISVSTQSGCSWTATGATSWLSITGGSSGTGSGSVSVSAQANSGASSRSATLTVAGKSVTVNQDAGTSTCSYQVSFSPRNFTWCGGDTSYYVTKTDGCAFDVTSAATWIQPVLVRSRTGGTLSGGSFIVQANTTGASRQGTVTIAGQTFTISQAARSGNGQYDGIWKGKTGSNRDFSACVADGAVQMFEATVVLDATSFTCTTQLVATTPLAISGSTFSGTTAIYPEISSVPANVTGSFSSSTNMSGSWTSAIPSGSAWVVTCGSSIAIGIGGSPLDAGTFTATKQP